MGIVVKQECVEYTTHDYLRFMAQTRQEEIYKEVQTFGGLKGLFVLLRRDVLTAERDINKNVTGERDIDREIDRTLEICIKSGDANRKSLFNLCQKITSVKLLTTSCVYPKSSKKADYPVGVIIS